MQARNFAEIIATGQTPFTTLYPPFLKTSSLSMVYAPRGEGKSQYCFFLAIALARGAVFAGNQAKESKVLYIDGEMGSDVWLQRLPKNEILGKKTVDNLSLLCPEDFENCQIPSIGDRDNQLKFLKLAEKYDTIFIDNYLTTCYQTDRRDDEISLWQNVQSLLIKLKRAGKAVVLVHHTSKSGVQYGSILKENLMDTIIRIRKFPKTLLEQGLTLELKVEKDRHNAFKDNLETCINMQFTDEHVIATKKDLTRLREQLYKEKSSYGYTVSELADYLHISIGEVKELKSKLENKMGAAI